MGRWCRGRLYFLRFGVHQGFVLGAVLFSLYMAPLDIIARHDLDAGIYGDDSQLYIACDTRNDYSTIFKIEECVGEIRCWVPANMLCRQIC